MGADAGVMQGGFLFEKKISNVESGYFLSNSFNYTTHISTRTEVVTNGMQENPSFKKLRGKIEIPREHCPKNFLDSFSLRPEETIRSSTLTSCVAQAITFHPIIPVLNPMTVFGYISSRKTPRLHLKTSS